MDIPSFKYCCMLEYHFTVILIYLNIFSLITEQGQRRQNTDQTIVLNILLYPYLFVCLGIVESSTKLNV